MAKYKPNKHKSSSTYSKQSGGNSVKIVAIIAVLLALVFAAYLVLSLVYHSWNPVQWVGSSTVTPPIEGDDPGEDDENGDNTGKEIASLIIDPDNVVLHERMNLDITPMSFTLEDGEEVSDEYVSPSDSAGFSEKATTGYTVTATAYLENGDEAFDEMQYFIFTTAWATPCEGQPVDFINIDSTDRTVTFSYKQAFETQIILICTSAFDQNIESTATIDCAKRFNGSIKAALSPGNFANPGLSVTDGSSMASRFKYEGICTSQNWTKKALKVLDGISYGIGTVEDTLQTSSAVFEYTSAMKTALTNKLPQYCPSSCYQTYSVPGTSSSLNKISVSQGDLAVNLISGGNNDTSWCYSSSSYMGYYKSALNSVTDAIKVTINLNFKYSGTFTISYYMNVSFDANVSSMGIGEDSSFIL